MKLQLTDLRKVLSCFSIQNAIYKTVKIKQDGMVLVLERYDGMTTVRALVHGDGNLGINKVLEVDWLSFEKLCNLQYKEIEIKYENNVLMISYGDILLVELSVIGILDDFASIDLGEVKDKVVLTRAMAETLGYIFTMVNLAVIVPPKFYNIKLLIKKGNLVFCASNVVTLFVSKQFKVGGEDMSYEINMNKISLMVLSRMLEISDIKVYTMERGLGYCKVDSDKITVSVFFPLVDNENGLPDVISVGEKERDKKLLGDGKVNVEELRKMLNDISVVVEKTDYKGLGLNFKKSFLELQSGSRSKAGVVAKVKQVKVNTAFEVNLDINLFKEFVNRSQSDLEFRAYKESSIVFIDSELGYLGIAECIRR